MSAPSRKAIRSEVGERLSHPSEPYLVEHERRAPSDPRRASDLRTDVREGLTGCRVVDAAAHLRTRAAT